MIVYPLMPHRDCRTEAVTSIDVTVARSADFLHLRYDIVADVGAIHWPSPVEPRFRDGLWQHTCFEAFARIEGRRAYREVNLAPSGEWAVYDFLDYRRGMTRAAGAPLRHFRAEERRIEAVVDIGRGDWDVGLAAVIEDSSGGKSYWALSHGSEKPDFHNPACFTATLPAPPIA